MKGSRPWANHNSTHYHNHVMRVAVLFAVAVVCVCDALPSQDAQDQMLALTTNMFSIAEGLGGEVNAKQLVDAQPDNIPHPLVPASILEKSSKDLKAVVESFTAQGVDDAGETVTEEMKFEKVAAGLNGLLSRLSVTISQRNHVIELLNAQANATDAFREELQAAVDNDRMFRSRADELVATAQSLHAHHTDTASHVMLLLSASARLLDEQLKDEKKIRARGVHMDVVGPLLDKEESKLQEAIDTAMLLVQMIAHKQQNEAKHLVNYSTALELNSCNESFTDLESRLSEFSTTAGKYRNKTEASINGLEAINIAEILEHNRTTRNLAIKTAQHATIQEQAKNVVELSQKAEQNIAQLGELLASSPTKPSGNLACVGVVSLETVFLNTTATTNLDSSLLFAMPTSLTSPLHQCALECASSSVTCTENCLRTRIHNRLARLDASSCVTCLAKVASLVQIQCAVRCDLEDGCDRCILERQGKGGKEQRCGDVLEMCGVRVPEQNNVSEQSRLVSHKQH
eukprot:c13073_g1_i1.p1 GENE.c13073_g1_i1~~c13073_g1_i1.p1  ORF type:complete len:515 (+),score=158.09 c13073_g1_i1:47-1591(+)